MHNQAEQVVRHLLEDLCQVCEEHHAVIAGGELTIDGDRLGEPISVTFNELFVMGGRGRCDGQTGRIQVIR